MKQCYSLKALIIGMLILVNEEKAPTVLESRKFWQKKKLELKINTLWTVINSIHKLVVACLAAAHQVNIWSYPVGCMIID